MGSWARGSAQQPRLRRFFAVEECLSCTRNKGWNRPCRHAMLSLLVKRGVASRRTRSHLLQISEIGPLPRLCNMTGTHLPHLPQPHIFAAYPPRAGQPQPSLAMAHGRHPSACCNDRQNAQGLAFSSAVLIHGSTRQYACLAHPPLFPRDHHTHGVMFRSFHSRSSQCSISYHAPNFSSWSYI
jgi:hypothetical protein